MGSGLCCNSDNIQTHTENSSEISFQVIEQSVLSIDKTFVHIPFPDYYSIREEKTSERFSDN